MKYLHKYGMPNLTLISSRIAIQGDECGHNSIEYILLQQLAVSPVTQQRMCDYYYTCAVDTQTIKNVMEGCRTFIIMKHLEIYGIL